MSDRPTKEDNERIVENIILPINSIVEVALIAEPNLISYLETSLQNMRASQSSAQAISGLILDMDDVDIRDHIVETYAKLVAYIKQRDLQIRKTTEIRMRSNVREQNIDELKKLMGF